MNQTDLVPDRQLLTEAEAAHEFRTTRQTLWKMRKQRVNPIPFYRIGGAILYDRNELYSYFRRGESPTNDILSGEVKPLFPSYMGGER
jgi:hypothetical protein